MSQQRHYYRICYPVQDRPRLAAGHTQYVVLDLSEEGAKLAVDGRTDDAGSSFPAVASITLKDGTTFAVMAVPQREVEDYLSVRFAERLPISVILGEQQRLLERYGKETLRSLQSSAAAI